MPVFHSDMDDKTLKGFGILRQRDERYCLRLAATGGAFSAEALRAAASLANRFGAGEAHLTTRQTVEIPHIAREHLTPLAEAMAAAGLRGAPSGARVRSVVACPRKSWCRFGRVDSQDIANRLAARGAERGDLPAKFKIAVSGCPNGCAKPVENDFGVMGQGGNRCAIFVGGRMGRRPRLGDRLPLDVPAEPGALVSVLEAVLQWYAENGEAKERLGATLERLGLDGVTRAVEESLAQPKR